MRNDDSNLHTWKVSLLSVLCNKFVTRLTPSPSHLHLLLYANQSLNFVFQEQLVRQSVVNLDDDDSHSCVTQFEIILSTTS